MHIGGLREFRGPSMRLSDALPAVVPVPVPVPVPVSSLSPEQKKHILAVISLLSLITITVISGFCNYNKGMILSSQAPTRILLGATFIGLATLFLGALCIRTYMTKNNRKVAFISAFFQILIAALLLTNSAILFKNPDPIQFKAHLNGIMWSVLPLTSLMMVRSMIDAMQRGADLRIRRLFARVETRVIINHPRAIPGIEPFTGLGRTLYSPPVRKEPAFISEQKMHLLTVISLLSFLAITHLTVLSYYGKLTLPPQAFAITFLGLTILQLTTYCMKVHITKKKDVYSSFLLITHILCALAIIGCTASLLHNPSSLKLKTFVDITFAILGSQTILTVLALLLKKTNNYLEKEGV